MTGAWFALPATGAGTRADAYQPDLHGHDVTGWSGIRDGDEFLVRIYADDATLDALAAESGVARHDGVPVQTLNQILGQERDAEEWERDFRIQTGDT